MTRRVVLVCGPPGAGKTTYARGTGLTVYDRDDVQWTSEAQFSRALRALGQDPHAQAVVIRSGATRTARGRARAQVGATEIVLITVPLDECIERIKQRGRPGYRTQIAAATKWWQRYEPGPPTAPKPRASTGKWSGRYDWTHRRERQAWAGVVKSGRATCWRCGAPIDPDERWDLGHDDNDRTQYRGPEHARCNRSAGARRGNAARRREGLGTSRVW